MQLIDIAQAQFNTSIGVGGKTQFSDAFEYVGAFFTWAIYISAGLAVLVLVYGAFLYTTSQGDQSKINDAKSWIYGAITGFILLVLTKLVISVIGIQ